MELKVVEVSDTTAFLKETYQAVRSDNASMTIERYAEKVGLGSSSLKMILSGKRKPTVHQVLCVARSLRLSIDETSYLETLCLRESAKNNWEMAYYSKLLNEKKKTAKLSRVGVSRKHLLSDPRVLPLLVYFIEHKDSELDTLHLSQQLKVSIDWVKRFIEEFEKDEVLVRQPDGKYHVVFDKLSHRIAQKEYYKKVLEGVIPRISSEYDNTSSYFVNYAFSASEDKLIQLQMDLKHLMEKYLDADSAASNEKVIAQAIFQVFPMIRPQRTS